MIMVTLTGDRHGRPQVDYTVNPAVGIPSITGSPAMRDPVAHALPAWDVIAGNICVSALLAAERYRLRGFGGQNVVLTLKDVAAATVGHLGMIADVTLNKSDRKKVGNSLYGAYGQDFVCADGRRVIVIGLTLRQWQGLISATGLQDRIAELEEALSVSLNDESHRWRYREEITALLKPWFAARTVKDFEAEFNAKGLTWSEFRTLKEALTEDSDLSVENPLFENVLDPDIGEYLTPRFPGTFSCSPSVEPTTAPELGAHTEEILSEVVGLGDRAIGKLLERGVVASSKHTTLS